MAIEKTIELKVNTGEAKKEVQDLSKEFDKLKTKASEIEEELKKTTDPDKINFLKKQLKEVNDELGRTSNNTNKASKSTKGFSNNVKVLGNAFKALGIGLIVSLVVKLTEVFSKNQKVVDGLNTVMETLNIAFNDFFNFLFDNSDSVISFFKDIFENPVENIKKLGNAIKDNIIERFNSLLEVLGFVGEAFTKFVTGDFDGAISSIKEAGKELVDVYTGVDNSVDKLTDGLGNLIDKGSEYLAQTVKQAKANVELSNTAELAAAQQARLVEQYDRQAEIQRQIRDDESRSITERQQANEKLAEVLEKQQEAMLKQAELQVAAAQSQLNINKNIENQVALTEALANKEGVLAQIEGFRSEQIVNRIALKKEEIELNNSISDAEKERRIAQLEFEEEQEETELGKIEKRRERLEIENEDILEDIERKRELYALGTQARIDAENEYLARKQEIDNEILSNELEANKSKKQSAKALEDAKVSLATNALGTLGALAKEGSEIAKGVAVAQATINTYQGVTSALAAPTTIPEPAGSILKFANAAAIGVAGAINVKNILATNTSGQGGGVSGGSAPSSPPAPSFNLVQGSGTNQIAESLQQGQAPIKAVVVSSDVTNQQARDRNIDATATL